MGSKFSAAIKGASMADNSLQEDGRREHTGTSLYLTALGLDESYVLDRLKRQIEYQEYMRPDAKTLDTKTEPQPS
jgi:hypothetical protein